jgi:hypothetical protein
MGGITPGAAKIALPESVASPSEYKFGINVESPTSAGDLKDLQKMSPSRTSHRSSGGKEDELASVAKADVPAVSYKPFNIYAAVTDFLSCASHSRRHLVQGREARRKLETT